MTQEYTPVTWQDETTSQQGTLINAERLNQMQTAHHFADGFEEVDAVPTADPSVAYHKVVYCTADNTFYRWDGTEWTKDIDDETKALLQQEIARATAAESELRGQLEDEHDARVDAEAAINDRITDEATELGQRIATEASTRYSADTALGTRITNETSARETADTNLGNRITAEATARAEADTALGNRITAEETRATQAEQANAQAIANTYTKAEADTLLAGKADQATTYSKMETDALLALKADQATTYTKNETDTLLASKADKSDTYTKAQADTAVQDALDSYAPMVRTTGNQPIEGIKVVQHLGGNLGTYARYSSGTYVKIAEFNGNTTNLMKISILKGGRYASGIFSINFNLASDHTISGLTGIAVADVTNLTIFGIQYNPTSDKYEVLASSTVGNELGTFIFLVSEAGTGIRIDMTIPDIPVAVTVQTGKQEVVL